jgi:hypothetical protein
MSRLLDRLQIASAFVPVDMQAAANNGDWINLKLYGRCIAVLFAAAGTAGDDPVFTLQQAQDNNSTGAKELNFERIEEKVGTLTSVGTFTTVTQSAANTYTNTASAEAQKIIAVEIEAADLDVANDFTHVRLVIPDVGGNAQLGCGFYILGDPKFAEDPMPTALD